MKLTNFIIIGIAALSVLFAGCEKDNYKAPKSILTGQVISDGQLVGLRSNGVQLELWQPGYQLFNKIPVYVAQDGTFSAELFDGDYKLTLVRGNGPWADKLDSLDVKVRGATQVDVPVDLFYRIDKEAFTREGNTVKATVNLEKVNGLRSLEKVKLYVGQTVLVDDVINLGNVEWSGDALVSLHQAIALQVDIPTASLSKGYVFARIGVKQKGLQSTCTDRSLKLPLTNVWNHKCIKVAQTREGIQHLIFDERAKVRCFFVCV